LSRSILFRDQQKTLDLLEEAAKEWADRAQKGEVLNDENAGLLAQMVRICVRTPDMIRDLWEWGKAEEGAGRLQDRQRAGDDLREGLEAWLQLMDMLLGAAKVCKAQGHPIRSAAKLKGSAAKLRAVLQEVNETWPPQKAGAPPLSYEELRNLADRFPPPAEWYEEEGDLF
jgi:hypothetical protein